MPSNAFSRICSAIQRPRGLIISFFTGSAILRGSLAGDLSSVAVNIGQEAFTTPGTYSWTAPAGVTSVCVVCVAGGDGGVYLPNNGGFRQVRSGRGGCLVYSNNVSVTPGQTYQVIVGAGGVNGGQGGSSSFGADVVKAARVLADCIGAVKNSGGSGDTASAVVGESTALYGAGGGGAGGYAGSGGNGGYRNLAAATAGTGGGGGGGAGHATQNAKGGNGGGVGIKGQGANGAGGTGFSGANGGAGSGGLGPSYGGGGGAGVTSSSNGGGGAVRIIWGPDRAFPSTNTGDL